MRRTALLVLGLAACAPAAAPASSPPPESRPAEREAVKVGDRLPAFEAANGTKIGGPPIKPTPGKVNLVVFWATWSQPDKVEITRLEPVWQRLRERGLAIAALSIDDDVTYVPTFAKECGATYPVGWDSGHAIANRFVVANDPSTYVVDRAGIVRFVHNGYHDGELKEIEREVESLL